MSPEVSRTDIQYVFGFVLANLVLKLALVPLNAAEYTDGILQLTVFQHDSGLYPPLFGALSSIPALSGLSLEMAGRVISAVASSFAVIPLFLLTRVVFGSEAARICAVLFTCSPLALRWSIHAMSDSLFLALSTGSIYLIIKAFSLLRDPNSTECADCRIAMASILAALATMTRYQGILLAPFLLFAVGLAWRNGRMPIKSIVGTLPWIAVAWWMVQNSGVHTGQFISRTAPTLLSTASAYWNTAESFLLISPYYFGYPVVALAVIGLLRRPSSSPAVLPFLVVYLIFGAAVLLLQSVFASFQYRYMLPVLPAFLVLAGGGAVSLAQLLQGKLSWVYRTGMAVAILYLAFFSMAVLVLQRQAFADQKAAAQFVREQAQAREPIYANEQYGSFLELGCVKLSFWAGRNVEPLYDRKTGEVVMPPANAWVLVGSHYGGSAAQEAIIARLNSRLVLQEISGGPFFSEVLPLMDDIMAQPGISQTPVAWVLRYVPQRFSTRVFRVAAPR